MIRNFKNIVIGLLCAALVLALWSNKGTETDDQLTNMQDGQKVYPAPLPSNLNFAGEIVPLEKFGIKERLDRELLVNTYWQSNSMMLIKRSHRAFKTIEPILAKNNIPEDFKYLAVAESGLINVTSSAGAKGVWQFMSSTAKSYDLEVNSEVDERLNLEKSTEAACKYLKEAYDQFGSWTLAAAAYNRGKSGIVRDLNKQLVSDYYDLHLNTETARYVFRILALKSVLQNPQAYGFIIQDKDLYADVDSKEIVVNETIENIAEWSDSIGSNYHVIKTMNPWLLKNQLTVKENTYKIKAPL